MDQVNPNSGRVILSPGEDVPTLNSGNLQFKNYFTQPAPHNLAAGSMAGLEKKIGAGEMVSSPCFKHDLSNNIFDSNQYASQQSYNSKMTTGTLKSEQMFSQITSGIVALREDLERECNDLAGKIDEIMRTDLLTFDKIKEQTSCIFDSEETFA